MKLTARLKRITELVPKSTCVGDVGSDHAYVLIDLVRQGVCEKGIASDIGEGPIENAQESIKRYNVSEKIEARLGSGLKPYEIDEIDTVIFAGMGGELIRSILETSDKLLAIFNRVNPLVLIMEEYCCKFSLETSSS